MTYQSIILYSNILDSSKFQALFHSRILLRKNLGTSYNIWFLFLILKSRNLYKEKKHQKCNIWNSVSMLYTTMKKSQNFLFICTLLKILTCTLYILFVWEMKWEIRDKRFSRVYQDGHNGEVFDEVGNVHYTDIE